MEQDQVEKIGLDSLTPSSRGRTDRKTMAFRLHLEGKDVQEIKFALRQEFKTTIEPAMIRRWIAECVEAVRVARPDLLKVSINLELSKIDLLERDFREAWDRSKQPKRKTRHVYEAPPKPAAPEGKVETRGRKKKADPNAPIEVGPLKNVIVETESQSGDVKFLLGVQWCIEQRLKLNGTSAPKENDFGDHAEEVKTLDNSEGVVAAAAALPGKNRIIFRTIVGDKQIGNG